MWNLNASLKLITLNKKKGDLKHSNLNIRFHGGKSAEILWQKQNFGIKVVNYTMKIASKTG